MNKQKKLTITKNLKDNILTEIKTMETAKMAALFIIFIMVVSSVSAFVLYLV